MKLDVESLEYELLPWLLTHGVLCRLRFVLVEWHLKCARCRDPRLEMSGV